ncbi:NADP-dependent 3-hydroxy acid dehydrogenase YdfG [Pustulibacterium marinum]|uniref:NADP-dependent 3-hydroxy acid dehydrogenase YdfG n=1 Tax=Pustulibacterium marinum TaxID=1224947 RepID=A0A1I7I1C1_9FLAO|nr:SDR family oxidoreductase [Pustulibacterium marinum]SFU66715.1 NADP-dependent 3-hydroxy acid dehydrogenase YdfG [Pustulibacterium marinum]
MKTIFITGASSGLGKATALFFQSKGWQVIATMRNPEKETELNQYDHVSLMELDVTNHQQIETVVAAVTATYSIDVVFNNAGYGLMSALEAMTDDQMTRQIETNLLGVIRVTKAFIPYFRAKQSGLFIATTSIGGSLAFPLHSLYQAAKFGVEGWSEAMSFELGMHHIGIKTVAPGAIATDFTGRSLDKNSHSAYETLEDKLFGSIEGMMDAAATPERIAAVVYEAATDGKDQVKYIAGPDAAQLYEARTQMGSEAFRKMIRTQFFGE